MENNKNKSLWIALVVVLVIVAGLILLSMTGSTPAFPSAPLGQNNGNTAPSVVTPTEDTSSGSVNAGATTATISYAQALLQYKNAHLQLNATCQANPDKMTFKNDALLMVDNRAPVDRVVKVGSIFNLKGDGFKIIKLSSVTLPATWLVGCDQSQNVASILIQK